MDIFQTIILALVQGLFEFLPVSSSAHLILLPKLMDWQDQGIAFDVVVHLGTLSAIVYYYKTHLLTLSTDFYRSLITRKTIGESKLAWSILFATIPVGLMGLAFKDFINLNLREIEVIAYTTLIFAVLLGFADWFNRHHSKIKTTINWFDVIFVGLMQTLALVPGVSRSGIVITAGLLLGFSRGFAIQFAFLLAIPVIALSSGLILLDLYRYPQSLDWGFLLLGFVLSALSSYFVIVFFIKLLEHIGLIPFVIYRLFLGLFLLAVVNF